MVIYLIPYRSLLNFNIYSLDVQRVITHDFVTSVEKKSITFRPSDKIVRYAGIRVLVSQTEPRKFRSSVPRLFVEVIIIIINI